MQDENKKIKRSTMDRVKNVLFDGADLKTVAKELWKYNVKPWIGDMLISLSGNVLTAIFNEEDFDDDISPRSSGHVAYDSISRKRKKKKSNSSRRRSRDDDEDDDDTPENLGPNEVHLVNFKSYAEGEEMLAWLTREIRRQGAVSVYDLYAKRKIATTNFRCNKMGWSDEQEIKRGRCYHGSDGYWHLKLATPYELDDDDYIDNQ